MWPCAAADGMDGGMAVIIEKIQLFHNQHRLFFFVTHHYILEL